MDAGCLRAEREGRRGGGRRGSPSAAPGRPALRFPSPLTRGALPSKAQVAGWARPRAPRRLPPPPCSVVVTGSPFPWVPGSRGWADEGRSPPRALGQPASASLGTPSAGGWGRAGNPNPGSWLSSQLVLLALLPCVACFLFSLTEPKTKPPGASCYPAGNVPWPGPGAPALSPWYPGERWTQEQKNKPKPSACHCGQML